MTTYFISRHAGAIEWIQTQGYTVDVFLPHLELAQIQAHDQVIGTLPLHLAAAVQQQGARYLHLTLEIPAQWRGVELSAQQLHACNARLTEYHITAL